MYIYKRRSDKMLWMSPNGDGNMEPDFETLGFDESITDMNKKFVSGFDQKKKVAIFDNEGIQAEETRLHNDAIYMEMDKEKKLCVEALAVNDLKELEIHRSKYDELKGNLK